MRAARALKDYVVTERLLENFDEALGLIRASLDGHTSKAAYLHGSFGSGKSHFMAVLHALLRGDRTARGRRGFDPVLAQHEWLLLTEEVAGPRRLLLAGHSWQVTYLDWSRRRCYVDPVEGGGKDRWGGLGTRSASYELTRAAREVLLGANSPVSLTRRAASMQSHLRDESSELVHPSGTVVVRGGRDTNVRCWTWACYRANATLAAALAGVADPLQRPTDTYIR
jgi:hypothetical protein